MIPIIRLRKYKHLLHILRLINLLKIYKNVWTWQGGISIRSIIYIHIYKGIYIKIYINISRARDNSTRGI